MNTGFIYTQPRPSDYFFGGESPLGADKLCPDRDWTPYLPVFESQSYKYFDPFDCVTRSAQNCLEILWKRQHGEEINFSDRFTAKMSGTTPVGNTFTKVSDSIRNDGLVFETDYTASYEMLSRNEYYAPIAAGIVLKGKNSLNELSVGYEWVRSDNDALYDALQYAPVQVAWFYGRPNQDNIYPRFTEQANHALALVKANYGRSWILFDSYNNNKLKEVAWDSIFWGSMRYNIVKKDESLPTPIMPNFNEGKMYQLVEGRGGAFLFSRGQLLTGEESKVLFAWMIMHNGDTKDHVGRLLLNDLKGVQLYDMGRNAIPNPHI